MGSCISKCKPKKIPKKDQQQQEENLKSKCVEKNCGIAIVEDKLLISQAPISSPPSKKPLISPTNAPSSPSFSCSNSNYPTTSSSSSSCSFLSSGSSSSSSVLSSELDRSVDNPHIIRHDYVISRTRSSLHTKCYASGNKPDGPRQQHPPSPRRVTKQAAQKRPRCNSPSNLSRQKSFRREPDSAIVSSTTSSLVHHKSCRREPDRPFSRSSRDLRPVSPSPSRRFRGEPMTTSMRRENFHIRPHSPSTSINSRRYGRPKNLVGKKDQNDGIKRIGSKMEEMAIGEMLSGQQEMDWLPIEDANNPHIALDCFIFL